MKYLDQSLWQHLVTKRLLEVKKILLIDFKAFYRIAMCILN